MTDYKIRVETELYDKLSPGFKKTASVVRSSSGEITKAFLDITRLSGSMEKAGNGFFDRIKTSTSTALTSTKRFNEEVSLLKENLKSTGSIKNLAKDFSDVKNKILSVNVSIFEKQQEIAAARLKQTEAQKKAEADGSKTSQKEAEKSIRAVKKLEEQEENLLRSKDRLLAKQGQQVEAFKKEGIEVNNLGQHLDKLSQKEKELHSELAKRQSIVGARENFKQVFKDRVALAADLNQASQSAFAVSSGVMNTGRSVYNKALPFERAVGDAAAAGFAGKGVAAGLQGKDELRKIIFDATKDTALGPTEMANIVAELLKAGDDVGSLRGESGKRNIQALSKLSIVGGLGAGETADLATTLKNQFGEKDYGAISDKLTNLANLTKTNLPEIAGFMKYAGVVAKDYGVSFDQTAAINAALASGGIRGETGGTTTRSLLFRLFSPTGGAKELYKQMGISTTKDGKFRTPEDIISQIAKGTSQLKPDQLAEVLNQISGEEAAPGLRILLKKVAELDPTTKKSALAGYEANFAKSSGSTNEYYEVSRDRTEDASKQLEGANERLSSTAMKSIEKPATGILGFLTSISNWATEFAAKHPIMSGVGAGLAALTAGISALAGGAAKIFAVKTLVSAVAQRGLLSVITGGLLGGGAAAAGATAVGAEAALAGGAVAAGGAAAGGAAAGGTAAVAGGTAAAAGGIAMGPILIGAGVVAALAAGGYGIYRLMKKYSPPTGGEGGLTREELMMFDETKYPAKKSETNIKAEITINANYKPDAEELTTKARDKFTNMLKDDKTFMTAILGVDS